MDTINGNVPVLVRETLEKCIAELDQVKQLYLVDPEKDWRFCILCG